MAFNLHQSCHHVYVLGFLIMTSAQGNKCRGKKRMLTDVCENPYIIARLDVYFESSKQVSSLVYSLMRKTGNEALTHIYLSVGYHEFCLSIICFKEHKLLFYL